MATAVTMENGPRWDYSRGRGEQQAWREHAAFMDSLFEDGFLVLGGPLGDLDGRYTMHLIEAADEAEIEARFADDPWAPLEMLRIARIERRTLWLDGRR